MPTYVHAVTSSGAETITNQLAGTAVARAGSTGFVQACFAASDADFTAKLIGRESGIQIIPSGSHPNVTAAANVKTISRPQMIFFGNTRPNEELELEITASAAGDTVVAVYVEA